MSTALQLLHWLAGFVTLAEALNKLERTCPLRPGLDARARLLAWLKALAWFCLALGAGGAVATPALLALGVTPGHATALLHLERPTLAETAVLLGFAVLIIRTRVKEG